jgi:hypothetical protein
MGYDTLQAVFAQKVTPDNDILLPIPETGQPQDRNGVLLYVGVGGDLTVVTVGGDEETFNDFPSGAFLPVRVVKVLEDTVASGIVALW